MAPAGRRSRWGAPVICRVYRQSPEKVAALVAVDGLLRRPAMKPEQAEQFTAPFRTPEYREHTTRFLASMFPTPGTEALRDRVLSEILATPQHVLLGAMEGMFGPGQPDSVVELPAPGDCSTTLPSLGPLMFDWD